MDPHQEATCHSSDKTSPRAAAGKRALRPGHYGGLLSHLLSFRVACSGPWGTSALTSEGRRPAPAPRRPPRGRSWQPSRVYFSMLTSGPAPALSKGEARRSPHWVPPGPRAGGRSSAPLCAACVPGAAPGLCTRRLGTPWLDPPPAGEQVPGPGDSVPADAPGTRPVAPWWPSEQGGGPGADPSPVARPAASLCPAALHLLSGPFRLELSPWASRPTAHSLDVTPPLPTPAGTPPSWRERLCSSVGTLPLPTLCPALQQNRPTLGSDTGMLSPGRGHPEGRREVQRWPESWAELPGPLRGKHWGLLLPPGSTSLCHTKVMSQGGRAWGHG